MLERLEPACKHKSWQCSALLLNDTLYHLLDNCMCSTAGQGRLILHTQYTVYQVSSTLHMVAVYNDNFNASPQRIDLSSCIRNLQL